MTRTSQRKRLIKHAYNGIRSLIEYQLINSDSSSSDSASSSSDDGYFKEDTNRKWDSEPDNSTSKSSTTNKSASSSSSSDSESEINELLEIQIATASYLVQNRYIGGKRANYRTKAERRHHNLFEAILENELMVSNREFRRFFRFSRQTFRMIHNKIKDHPAFHVASRKPQMPSHFQLLVFLYFAGQCGSGNNSEKLAFMHRIGSGTVDKYKERVSLAIISLREDYLTWPNVSERKQISLKWQEEHKVPPNMICAMDGTYIYLSVAPARNRRDYNTRKKRYGLNLLLWCDHKLRVRWYEFGWPGSVGDNRIWKNSRLYRHHHDYYSPGEYSISDSGVDSEHSNVSLFSKRIALNGAQKHFNKTMAKPRTLSEHLNSRLKGRFQALKEIRTMIGKDGNPRADLKRIHRILLSCIILHNMTAKHDDFDPAWEDGSDTDSDDEDNVHENANDNYDVLRESLVEYCSNNIVH